jgi:hypothetical protein
MNPFLLLLLAQAMGKSTQKSDQAVNAYKIPNWMLTVVDLGTGGLSLVLADQEQVGFVTDGTRVVTVRYGTADKAAVALAHLNAGAPREAIQAKFWAGPNAVVIKSPHLSTIVFDADNISTVESGHFLGKCFQGTQLSCSALISKILAAGINLDPAAAVVGRGGAHLLHRGRVPARAQRWQEVLQFLDR